MLHDVHCHIDLFPRPETLVRSVEAAGVFTLAVSNTPAMYRESSSHLMRCKFIKPALGLHPLASVDRNREACQLRRMLGSASYVGEIGLNRTAGQGECVHQERAFREIMMEAGQHNCVISIHSKGMEKTVLQVLRDYRAEPAILHWYTGPIGLINDFVSEGHYFSVNLLMILQPRYRKMIGQIPHERILTESDGPFAQVAGKPLSPLRIAETVFHLSRLWKMPALQTERVLERNLEELAQRNGVSLWDCRA